MNRESFLEDLKSLVEMPTVVGERESFEQAFKFVRGKIDSRAIITELENEGETIFIASNHSTKKPDVCFIAHIDVVAGHEEQFYFKEDGDKVYGRGVSDMKFSIPMGYALLNKLIAEQSKLTFSFVVTSDEERGGFRGAQYLADTYALRPTIVICPDGGDNFVCIHKSKGVFQAKVSAQGSPAHASRPWLGKNALEPIVKLAAALFDKYNTANTLPGWNTTVNIGMLNGGKTTNQVPGDALTSLDFRFVPENDSPETLKKMLTDLAESIDPKILVTVSAVGEAMLTDIAHPAFALFTKTLSSHIGRAVTLEGAHGSNDARHFSKHGSLVLMTKPDGGDIHGDTEWLDVPSTLVFFQVLSDFLLRYEEMIHRKKTH